MMVDRLLLSDVKEEILEMQYEINATYNPPPPPPPPIIPTPVQEFQDVNKIPKMDHEQLLSPSKAPLLSPVMKSSPIGMLQSPESRLLPQMNQYPSSLHSPMSAASPYMMPNSPLVERFPPCMHQGKKPTTGPNIPQTVSQQQQRPLMVSQQLQSKHKFYPSAPEEPRKAKKQPKIPVEAPKKDMENFDIESEITPSFIMKNAPVPCEDSSSGPILPEKSPMKIVNEQDDTLTSHHSSPMKDMNNSSAGSDDMDIDYFGNPPHSQTSNALSDFDRLKNESNETTTNNENHGNSVGDADSEPYDEWLCIQKALEEHNTRPLGHHLENRTNGYQQEQQSDLFPHNPTQSREGGKLEGSDMQDDSPPSPFAELFNAGDINAAAASGSSNDSSVKETMGQMYGGDVEEISAKNSEIVESRLEALFEGKRFFNAFFKFYYIFLQLINGKKIKKN